MAGADDGSRLPIFPGYAHYTTVRLAASAIASIVPLGPASESFTLARGVAKPKAGQVLLVGRGELVPDGLIAVVRTVTANSSGVITVTAADGTLGDAYAKLAAVATKST